MSGPIKEGSQKPPDDESIGIDGSEHTDEAHRITCQDEDLGGMKKVGGGEHRKDVRDRASEKKAD